MKKILIFIDWYYPAFKAGGPIQSCKNFVEQMQSNYQIDVFTSNTDFDSTESLKIEKNKWVNGFKNESVFYCSSNFYSKKLIKELIETRKPDFIYFNSMFSLRFTILPLFYLRKWSNKNKVILAPRGMLQKGAMQFKTAKKVFFLNTLKLSGLSKKIIFQATDQQEMEDINYYFPKNKGVSIVSNFSKTLTSNFKTINKIENELKAVFISRIVEKKNLLFVINSFKNISTSYKVILNIYGDIGDNSYWDICKKEIKFVENKNISIVYHGAIPNENVATVLEENHLFYLPSYGENFGHAIYESFSCGRPVLISTKTPWRNLQEKKAGWDLNLENPNDFKEIIETVAQMKQNNFDILCKGAFKISEEYHNTNDLKKKYELLFS